jgi:hypothetical protein
MTILLKNSSSPWCTLLAQRSCLHYHSSKENDVIKVKLLSRDHSSTNSKHACAEGIVTNLKRCYGESADNFWLKYVHPTVFWRIWWTNGWTTARWTPSSLSTWHQYMITAMQRLDKSPAIRASSSTTNVYSSLLGSDRQAGGLPGWPSRDGPAGVM